VRTVLRESRFAMPRGISLVVQGITSGPVWDKVCQTIMSAEPAQHHRLRRLVSRAFTPRAAERMRGACVDVINELIDRHSAAGHCDMVYDIALQYRSRSSAPCWVHRPRSGNFSHAGPTTSVKPSAPMSQPKRPPFCGRGGNSTHTWRT